jgi:hypothetical protein
MLSSSPLDAMLAVIFISSYLSIDFEIQTISLPLSIEGTQPTVENPKTSGTNVNVEPKPPLQWTAVAGLYPSE